MIIPHRPRVYSYGNLSRSVFNFLSLHFVWMETPENGPPGPALSGWHWLCLSLPRAAESGRVGGSILLVCFSVLLVHGPRLVSPPSSSPRIPRLHEAEALATPLSLLCFSVASLTNPPPFLVTAQSVPFASPSPAASGSLWSSRLKL